MRGTLPSNGGSYGGWIRLGRLGASSSADLSEQPDGYLMAVDGPLLTIEATQAIAGRCFSGRPRQAQGWSILPRAERGIDGYERINPSGTRRLALLGQLLRGSLFWRPPGLGTHCKPRQYLPTTGQAGIRALLARPGACTQARQAGHKQEAAEARGMKHDGHPELTF